jgi:lipopolysaccharide biosynthesis glycosyltransferase
MIQMEKSFHIAFGVDDNYVRPMGVLITSILENTPNQKFVFHVFTQDISNENASRLEQLAKKYNTQIKTHLIDDTVFQKFSDFPKFRHYSTAIFYRLLIPAILQSETDRVLYLDADILCIGNIQELIDMNMGDHVAAVVHDSNKTAQRQSKSLGLKNGKYFNSGFLMMNLKRWTEENVSQKIMSSLAEKGKTLPFPDQDALNMALDGKAFFLDRKWNYQYRLTTQLKVGKTAMDVPGDSVFIHFIGAMKPWRYWSPHESKKVFDRFQSASTLDNGPFNEKMHYKEMHALGAFYMKKGKVLQGMKWYMSYITKKCLTFILK